jgi:hypothetical protein
MTSNSPDPIEPQRLAEAILAIERRVAVLEENRRVRSFAVKRPRLGVAALLTAVIGFLFTQPEYDLHGITRGGPQQELQPPPHCPRRQIVLIDGLAIGYRWILAGCVLAGAASLASRRNGA